MNSHSDETGLVIGYSKWKVVGFLLLYAGLAGMCAYGLSQGKWLVAIGVPIFVWSMLIRGQALLNHKPQLRINDLGIQLRDEPLDSWGLIAQPEVYADKAGRNTLMYLRYQAGGQERAIEISNLDVEADLLEVWIENYQSAYTAASDAGQRV